MKSTEFITESMDEHDAILHNLLKMVIGLKKHPERKANKLSINELLYNLGVKNNWDTRTFDHPLSQPMRKEAQKFINAITHNFTGATFNRQDIKHLADVIYKWSQAVNDSSKKPYIEDAITESINDKGIFKACFLSGLPGSGKSTVIGRITDGTVEPRIVNTDKSYEFLLGKNNMKADAAAWELLGPVSKTINANMLYNYINSMLPMFVDGTSANPGALLRRTGLLESIGYDTMMIWVSTSLEESIRRAQARERKVDADFIKRLHVKMDKNKQFYKQRFGGNFVEVDNEGDNFNSMEAGTYSAANKFFNSPVQNPIGEQTIQKLEKAGQKYLISVTDPKHIKKMISVWYQK